MTTRGRPRAFDRQIALERATALFWRKGYTATSMADLCETMELRSPSIYAAFGNKEALYEQALEHYAAQSGPAITAPLRNETATDAAIGGFLRGLAATLPKGDTPAGCMIALSMVAEEGCTALGEHVAGLRREGLRALEDRLRAGVIAGDVDPSVNIERLAKLVATIQQGLSLQARDGADKVQLAGVVDAFMAVWPHLARVVTPEESKSS